MKIHKEGYKIIPIAFVILILLDLIIYFLLKEFLIFYLIQVAAIVLAFLVVYFFRVPNRNISEDENVVLAPSDGKIVVIEEVFEKEYFKENRLQVSIFMSPLNVHQNRAPVTGEVTHRNHINGRFLPAFVPKSSEENERCSTVFKMKNGTEILSRQIAGTVARRIANYSNVGKNYKQGEEYGFIRFGSRVDVFLPLNAKVKVELNQKSIGGKTVLANLN